MKKNHALFALIMSLLITACTSTEIYSPSLNLSDHQLHKDEIEIQAGIAPLPETRGYKTDSKNNTTFGGNMEIGYGFSNLVNLHLTGWTELNDNAFYRGGLALSSRINLYHSDSDELTLIPKVAIVMDNWGYEGHGFELPIIYLNRLSDEFYYYGGLGFILGVHSYEKEIVDTFHARVPFGYGVLGHFGAGFNINRLFRVTLELCPIYQYSYYDQRSDFIFSPTLSFGVIIR